MVTVNRGFVWIAPMDCHGPRQFLICRQPPPNELKRSVRSKVIFVIMDNLGSHKGKAVRALIRATGAKLFFLPQYSPT